MFKLNTRLLQVRNGVPGKPAWNFIKFEFPESTYATYTHRVQTPSYTYIY